MQITEIACDACFAEDRTRPGESRTIAIDGELFDVDLCEHHDKALITPLREALATFGRKPNAAIAATPAPKAYNLTGVTNASGVLHTCIYCGHQAHRDNMRRHARDDHSVSMSIAIGSAQMQGRCPKCEKGLPNRHSLTMHLHRAHGIALAEAKKRDEYEFAPI